MRYIFTVLIISSFSLYSAAADLVPLAGPTQLVKFSISQPRVLPGAEIEIALKNQRKLNEFVAKRAMELFVLINNSPDVFGYSESGRPIEPKSLLWSMEPVADESRHSALPVYRGNKASEAITDIFAKGGKFECYTICNLVAWKIINDLLGDAIFDATRSKAGLNLGLLGVAEYLGTAEVSQTVGSKVYITNIPIYTKLIKGPFTGENVFRVTGGAEPTYIGFGEFFRTARTEAEILEHLYQETTDGELASTRQDFVGLQEFYRTHKENWYRDQHVAQLTISELGENFFDLQAIRRVIKAYKS